MAAKRVLKLDLYLGIPSIILDPEGSMRRRMYGKAGAFRKKSYGLEYRVLSNFWIFDEKYIYWIFEAVHRALSHIHAYHDFDLVRKTIDTNDIEIAHRIIKDEGLQLPL